MGDTKNDLAEAASDDMFFPDQMVVDVKIYYKDLDDQDHDHFVVPYEGKDMPVKHAGGFFAFTNLHGNIHLINQDSVDEIIIFPRRSLKEKDYGRCNV